MPNGNSCTILAMSQKIIRLWCFGKSEAFSIYTKKESLANQLA